MKLPTFVMGNLSTKPESLLPGVFKALSIDVNLWQNPTVQHAYSLLKGGKYLSFLSLTDSWALQSYGSPAEHLAWNQLACIFKKYPFEDPSVDREAAAWEKFLQAEHRCRRINQRFRARQRTLKNRRYESFLDSARRWIRRVIGDYPNLQKIYCMCDFGPGSSVGVHGLATHAGRKLDSEAWTCTPTAVPLGINALGRNVQVWETLLGSPFTTDRDAFRNAARAKIQMVDYNYITFVPKTAKIHRTIAIEPLINGFVQKGVDLYLRSKLRRFNIDLSDQSVNQHLAMQGSLPGSNPFSTIDLSSASDSISIELVRELLPPEWYSFLNAIRSPCYRIAGSEVSVRYEKFTSMGNGFCFPLETLIFASLVHSVYEVTGDRDFSVYGDDIIVRQSSALLVLEVLKYCGFRANVDKTFVFGPFRESCGADFFEGVLVRPYYIDEIPQHSLDLFKWLNGLRRLYGESRAWTHILRHVPDSWILFRPIDGPDDAITTEHDTFIGCQYSKWLRHQQRWSWVRATSQSASDTNTYSLGSQMYGLLRGSPSDRGRMRYTLRRKTRTRVSYNS